MTRSLCVTCDGCGKEAEGETWPEGWYLWRGQDLCHECAVPKIVAALRMCEPDDDDIPLPIWVKP